MKGRMWTRLSGIAMAACMTLSLFSGITVRAGEVPGEVVQLQEFGTLTNGLLTENAEGWTITGLEEGDGEQGYSFSGGYCSLFTSESNEGVEVSVSQTIANVEGGEYVVSFAAVGNDGKNNMTMTVTNLTTQEKQEVVIVPNGWDNWNNILSSKPLAVNDGDNVQISFAGNLVGKEWYGIKNVTFSNVATAVEAPISVEKVEGLSEDFIHGVDVSTYLSEIQSGVTYKDENGNEQNMFEIFRNAGVNYVRLRVWNCPFRVDEKGDYLYVDDDGREHSASEVTTTQNEAGFYEYALADGTAVYREGYGAGNCDIDTAVATAKIAQQYGMKILIDFHYSDFWADPAKYRVPKAWKDMNLEQKTTALSAYTTECLQKLKDAGVDVSMVQVGNEINNGMAGETGENELTLVKAGCEAVRAFDKDIQIAIHYADPHREGYQAGKAADLENAGIDYDVFATSYYSFWHGSTDNLTAVLKTIADTYHKKVMVAEVSYCWTEEDGDGASNVVNANTEPLNYSVDAEGQAASVRDAIAAVNAVGEAGIGTFYWEAAWVPVKNYQAAEDKEKVLADNVTAWTHYGSGWASQYCGPKYDNYDPGVAEDVTTHGSQWDNQGFFDFDGKALPSINVYKYVYTGAEGPVKVDSVENFEVTMGYQTEVSLPEVATVTLNDGNKVENVPVIWNETEKAALKTADFGEYIVNGKLGAFSYASKGDTIEVAAGKYKTVCKVSVAGTNYVPNGSFEEGPGAWTITGIGRFGEDAGNAKSGKCFVDAWTDSDDGIDFTVEQTFDAKEVPSGEYFLNAYYQGTNVESVKEDARLYIKLNYADKESKIYETADIKILNVWKEFYQAKVRGIEITEDVTSITVGSRMSCAKGWVVVDDFALMKCKDLSTPVANKYTVTYNVNGGNKLKTSKVTVKAGSKISTLPKATRKGYQFKGWYTKTKGGTKVSTKTIITKNVTFYAQWTKVAAPAKVTKVTAKAGTKQSIKVSYAKAKNVAGYEVRYSKNANMKSAKKLYTASTSATIKKLKKGNTYYITVYSYVKDSTGAKIYSKSASNKVKVKVK